jgi:hypothetical protein
MIALLSKDPSTQVHDLAPVDSRTPFDCFAHNGYYVVDGKIFQHKVYAMQEATRKNLKPKDITWVFNNDAYAKVDWKVSSGLPLTEWYRQRALQLRAKYDYLILAFSGGGDSTNVLDSFVLNNIHIDEVVSWWPRSNAASNYRPSMDSNVENFRSEYDYLVEPKLKWLEKVAPNTKITICDNLQDLRPEDPTNELVEITTNHCWTGIQRYRAIDDVYFERQKKHKNCAILMGVNPPVPVLVEKHFFVVFFEFGTNTQYSSDLTNRGLRNVEFFYWTPDMPLLVREQAHALLKNLRANPQNANIVTKWSMSPNDATKFKKINEQNGELRRRWIKSVIYPSYNSNALQIDKHKSPINRPDWFSWFYDNPHADEILQPHRSAVTAHQNLSHPDFFIKEGNEIHNYIQYKSKLHYIGDWSETK